MEMSHLIHSLLAIINGMSPYILLGFLIAGLLHVFVNPSTMSRHLAGSGIKPVVKAALFGIPLPLCSCGVLPTAVSLRRRGASKGASTSFLIATPQTGVDSIAATYSLLGLPFAVIRPVAALAGAVAGGLAVGKWGEDDSSIPQNEERGEGVGSQMSFWGEIVEALRYGFVDMVASVGKWLVIGLIIAALITVFVPDTFFLGLKRYPLLAMLAMVVVAVPMYICATGSIPVALSLMLKGLSPGTAFVLLMAGPAANFASLMVLGRTYGKKATIIYVASVIVIAIAFGLIIDLLLPAAWFDVSSYHLGHHGHSEFSMFAVVCSAVLVGLLINAAIQNRHHSHNHNITDKMEREYKIEGMACPHCKAAVEKALKAVPGVESVNVDLNEGKALVTGEADSRMLIEAVRLAGYECK